MKSSSAQREAVALPERCAFARLASKLEVVDEMFQSIRDELLELWGDLQDVSSLAQTLRLVSASGSP